MRTLPVLSLAPSAIAWLGVVTASVWRATWQVDVLSVLLALLALACGILAVIVHRRDAAAWAAFAVSVIFPIGSRTCCRASAQTRSDRAPLDPGMGGDGIEPPTSWV